jgi:hypothetical protein
MRQEWRIGAIRQGSVELSGILRYTGSHDRRGPQRSGLFGAGFPAGAFMLPGD